MYCKTCEKYFNVDAMHSGIKCKDCHREYQRVYHQKWLKRVKAATGTSYCKHCEIFKLNKDMKYKSVCLECYNDNQKQYYQNRKQEAGNAKSEQGVRQERSDGGAV